MQETLRYPAETLRGPPAGADPHPLKAPFRRSPTSERARYRHAQRMRTTEAHQVALRPDGLTADEVVAVARADALPQEGVHRFVRPLARAWTHMAAGDVAGADEALQAFVKALRGAISPL